MGTPWASLWVDPWEPPPISSFVRRIRQCLFASEQISVHCMWNYLMHQYSVCINQFMMAIKSGIYVFKSITRQQRKISNLTRKSRITYILYSLSNQIKTIDVCCFFIVMLWRYTTSKDNPYRVTFSAYQSVMSLQNI